MANTRTNLDIQSDLVVTEPTIQTRMKMKDAASVQTLFVDFDEPAGADRTVNFTDPGADDTVAYLDAAQVFQNKQITTAPIAGDDVTNKTYVDTTVAGSVPVATSGIGGGVQGKVTADEAKGLRIAAGIMEILIDNSTIIFNGSGQLVGAAAVADGSAGPGGATKGILTADTNKGIDITAGILEVKVDGATVAFNPSGQLEVIGGGGGGGGPVGTVSGNATFTEDSIGITAPSNGSTGGGDISTLDFLANAVNGTRFAFSVPDDYFNGPMSVSVVYQMSVADPAGTIEVTTQAKIVDVSAGVIDSVSHPETQASLTVQTTTDVERRVLLALPEGDFANGDMIQFLVKRIGNDVSDTNAANWKVLSFQFAYTAIVNGRIANRQSKFFENAPGETPTNPNTISSGDISVEDFPTTVDTALKFEFTVPDNWDEITNAEVRLTYVMSATDTGDVRLEVRGKNARPQLGTIDTIALQNFDFTPGAGGPTVSKQTNSIISIPANALSRGDAITLIIARRGTAGADTHTADLQLICAIISFGVLSAASVSAVTIQEEYLNQGVFGAPSGAGVDGDTDFTDLGGDFETFDRLSSTIASGSLSVSYQGRLGGLTSQIKDIRFFIKGSGATPQWTLNIYVEGTGIVHTDGPNVAPLGSTEIVKTDLDLSAQPTGSARFFVVIVANIDAGETVFVSRPFVRLE